MGKSGQTVCHVRSRFFLLPRPASLCALQVTSAPMVVRARSWLPYTCRPAGPAGPSLSRFNIFMEANEQEPYVPISFALCHHPSSTGQSQLNRSTSTSVWTLGSLPNPNEKKLFDRICSLSCVCVCVFVCLFVCVCGWMSDEVHTNRCEPVQ